MIRDWLVRLGVTRRADADDTDVGGQASVPSLPAVAGPNSVLNPFALRLLGALPAADTQVVSPHCLAMALAMLARGAAGATYAQLRDSLGIPDSPEALQRYVAMLRGVASSGPRRDCVVESAAALWADRSTPLLESFVDDVRQWFGADVASVDFTDKNATAEQVNGWCGRVTRNRVTRIVGPDTMPRPPALLMTTAIYFKGGWTSPFEEGATITAPFHAPSGDVPVRLMYQTIATQYAETDDVQMVALPYFGRWQMTIILPRASSSLGTVVQRLRHPHELERLSRAMSKREVRLSLPRVSIDSGAMSLLPALTKIGIEAAFGLDTADFSRLTPLAPTWAIEVLHRATLDVDEAGTIATAATAIEMPCGSSLRHRTPRPVVMRVDRPYLMLVQAAYDGMILFAATVTQPPAAS